MILQPIEDGDATISEKIIPIKSSSNRFEVDFEEIKGQVLNLEFFGNGFSS